MMVNPEPKEIVESLVKLDPKEHQESLALQDHLDGEVMEVLREKKENRERKAQRVLLVLKVQWVRQDLWGLKDALEMPVQRDYLEFQALLGSKG